MIKTQRLMYLKNFILNLGSFLNNFEEQAAIIFRRFELDNYIVLNECFFNCHNEITVGWGYYGTPTFHPRNKIELDRF